MARSIVMQEDQIVTPRCMGKTMRRFYFELLEKLKEGGHFVRRHSGAKYKFFVQDDVVMIQKISGGFGRIYLVQV